MVPPRLVQLTPLLGSGQKCRTAGYPRGESGEFIVRTSGSQSKDAQAQGNDLQAMAEASSSGH